MKINECDGKKFGIKNLDQLLLDKLRKTTLAT